MTVGADNRRRFPRVERSVITYYRKLVGDTTELAALTRNVSRGGILVSLEDPLKVGDVLSVELVLPDGGGPINAIGKVVRSEDTAVGIQFANLPESEGDRLERFVTVKMKSEGRA